MNADLKKPNVERLLTTMRGGIPDRVPNYEILIEARNVKTLLGRDVGTTMAASRGASDQTLFCPPMAPELFAEICHKTGMDAMTLESLWTPLKYRDEQGNLHNVNDGRINEWEDLERAIGPDWEHDFGPRREVIRNYVRVAKENNLGVVWCTNALNPGSRRFLDLGDVRNIAVVRLNGKAVGAVWTRPFRVEVTGTLKAGANELEIEVINLWPNRLIGDAALPAEKRVTRTNRDDYKKGSKLLESGLLGPVWLMEKEGLQR